MKNRICLIVVLTLVFGLFFSSCKKYEEDYGLMLKSPKGRLVGTWKITQIDSDTTSIKMSDYAMFGELQMTFKKDETGSIKFKDNGLGEMLGNIDWDELMGEVQDSTYTDSIDYGPGDLDFTSLLSTETEFKWAFDDKKEYLKFSMYDSTSSAYVNVADMKILSLCKSDCKFRYEEDSTRVDVSMQK